MSAGNHGRKPKMRYSKVVVNIPQTLIQRFDRICEKEGFTRQEAIKQSIRDFIYDYTDENEVEPEQLKEVFKGMFSAMKEVAEPDQSRRLEFKK
jgi:metal-responsive CopG/Arc/MetJ family transcriptional regulator